MKIKAYHKDLNSLHVNCEKPRAYFVPYESREKAIKHERNDSDYFTLLNGEWNFRFYKSFEDIEDDFLSKPFDETISVPKCWQTEVTRGYDAPLYSNLKYPFPLDPPFVPVDNPAGHYNRIFNLKLNKEKEYYINFEGVSSCFYLFVNSEFCGYSQVSHCTSEINITEKLVDGENRIDVVVVKWCDGSYLEDQDMFRLSGIFRDTYILERDKNCVKDIFIRTDVNDSLDRADITLDTDCEIRYELLDGSGKTVLTGSDKNFTIDNPVLWNSEQPYSYTLIVSCGNEFIPFNISLKRLEFKGNVAYFNGKPVKLLGVNRHDNNPDTGYYTSVEDMKKDLFIMKQANINTIRTSHYPNSPLFMELCEKYGFMMVDEADIETHGMGFEYKDTWDWFRWSKCSTDDEWEDAYVDRAQRLFERDKNFGNVIMWSLGNESGCGKNHRAMGKFIKSRDSRAIVHYENSHLEFKAVPVGENFSDISDVESRMYSSLEYTEEYAKSKWAKKPFFFCEYCCSMSTGDIHAHVDLIRKYPAIFGGCFWEFSDHAIRNKNGDFRYGGDFGDYPNDDICCVDGVVFPDRTLRPGFDDLKKAYEPVECKYEKGVLTVFNRNYFAPFKDADMKVSLKVCGNEIYSLDFTDFEIAPQDSLDFKVDADVSSSDCAFLDVTFTLSKDMHWADKGFEIAFAQFDLSSKETDIPVISAGIPEYTESSRYISVSSGDTEYVFDKPYGVISDIKVKGKKVNKAPISINIRKAPGNNELGRYNECKSASMECAVMIVHSTEVIPCDNSLDIVCNVTYGGASVVPVLSGKMIYKFYGDACVDVVFDGETRKLLEEMNLRLPKFGFELPLDRSFRDFTYFGKGPNEAYPERHKGQRYGKFTTDVDSNFVPYIFPMENGAHFGTRYAEITNGEATLTFRPVTESTFIFNAAKYDSATLEMTKHNDELPESDATHICLDYRMDLRGGRGIYETLEPERKWDFGKFTFGVRIKAQ